jgi:threonine/homoserine/homoserine lactone efflux protein
MLAAFGLSALLAVQAMPGTAGNAAMVVAAGRLTDAIRRAPVVTRVIDYLFAA